MATKETKKDRAARRAQAPAANSLRPAVKALEDAISKAQELAGGRQDDKIKLLQSALTEFMRSESRFLDEDPTHLARGYEPKKGEVGYVAPDKERPE